MNDIIIDIIIVPALVECTGCVIAGVDEPLRPVLHILALKYEPCCHIQTS